jgi:hypothetical protein
MITVENIASTLSTMINPYLIDPNAPAFYVWARPDRAIISINPRNVKNMEAVFSKKFTHQFSTILGGPRLEMTNSRGIYFQVGYTPVPPPVYKFKPLDLAAQENPLALPIGETLHNPMWLNLYDMGSVLIGGSRRMGKTRFLHGWIQALIHGGSAELWLYDGKDGLEFSRYEHHLNVRLINDFSDALSELQRIANERAALLTTVRATSMIEYNERVSSFQQLSPIVLFVDEVALIPSDTQATLAKLIAWSGAHGIYPILATQRTGVDQVQPLIKTNLATRISFRVPALSDSRVILDRAGAQDLPNIPGRLCMVWDGEIVTAQAYQVELPGGPEIKQRDIELAAWIRDEHNGAISISRLMTGKEMSEWEARQLIEAWQNHGWLVNGGNGVARRLTPAILALLPHGDLENSSLSGSTEDK